LLLVPQICDLTTTTAPADAAVKPSLAEQLIAGGLIWRLRRMFDGAAAVET